MLNNNPSKKGSSIPQEQLIMGDPEELKQIEALREHAFAQLIDSGYEVRNIADLPGWNALDEDEKLAISNQFGTHFISISTGICLLYTTITSNQLFTKGGINAKFAQFIIAGKALKKAAGKNAILLSLQEYDFTNFPDIREALSVVGKTMKVAEFFTTIFTLKGNDLIGKPIHQLATLLERFKWIYSILPEDFDKRLVPSLEKLFLMLNLRIEKRPNTPEYP